MKTQYPDFAPKRQPGDICTLISILTAIFGAIYCLGFLFYGDIQEALVLFISVFLFYYLWNSLGKTMNLLKEAQEQIEDLHTKLKQLKEETPNSC